MKKKIQLNDVALREGDQVEGGKMSPRDQITYIKYLLEGGIDRIEIGYPGSSEKQLKRCKEISEFIKNWSGDKKPLISGLASASKPMIDAVKEAGCDICHIYIPASEEFISAMFSAEKYGDTIEGKRQWVKDQAVAMVSYAKSIGFKHIEYSPEDAARSSKEFICELLTLVIKAGATVVNIPDTTGLRILNEYGELISYIRDNTPNIHKVKISVHAHNDSDCSTNNALQAILSGADIIEGTFYGLGERSGMTKFETVIMNLQTRKDVFKDHEITFQANHCYKIVNFIANSLGMPVPRHWVVVGAQNNICSSGTHQAIQARATDKKQGYYSWDPKKFGHIGEVNNVINQSSGRAGIRKRLSKLGYNKISADQLDSIYKRSMAISDAKGGGAVESRDLTAIVQDVLAEIPFPIKIVSCQAMGGKGTEPVAIVHVDTNKSDGISGHGNGTFDAVMNAVKQAAIYLYPQLKGIEIALDDWRPIPITSGSESLADVYSRIRVNGKGVFSGRAVDPDTIQASAQSFANCISWYLDSLAK